MVSCNKMKLDRRQWVVLGVICSAYFAISVCEKILGPFYPRVAESKNATATEYGLVFGVYDIVCLIFSPLLANFIDKINVKLLINTGVYVAAVSSILFGLLDLLHSHTSFIVCSFLVRIGQALGTTAILTSAFTIVSDTFPDNISTGIGTLETFYGLGGIVGPAVSGILYAQGGYILSFTVMGSMFLLVGVVSNFALPSFHKGEPKIQGNFLKILKVPAVLLDALSVMSCVITSNYYSVTLEPHIRQFQLGPVSLGMVFAVKSVTYLVGAPTVGRLCDKIWNPCYIILVGHVLDILSVILTGPPAFVPLDPSLPLVITGQVFQGLSVACIFVPSFDDATQSAVANGFPDGIVTYGLVSGMVVASMSLGSFIGSSVGGLLNDLVGFRWGCLFSVTVHIIVLSARLTHTWWHCRPVSKPCNEARKEAEGGDLEMEQVNDTSVRTENQVPY